MKKLFAGFAIILGIGTMNVQAQSITGGIKADASMSNFILTDMDDAESTMNIGASLGGFAKFDMTRNFAIQPELLVHYRSSDFKQGGIEDKFQYWGLEIPVYAMGQWYSQNDNRFYVGAGPYVGLGLSAKYDKSDTDLYKEVSGNTPRQRFDFGFGVQVGYEFYSGIQINAGYKIGVIDALDYGKDNATMLPQAISLGVGFRF